MLPAEIDAAIDAVVAATGAAVDPTGDAGISLTRAVAAAARGGKRMRARALAASYAAHGGSDPAAIAPLAAALELFQAAALVHDDILDSADTRRGRPTPHRAFADAHRAAGLAGDPDHHGVSAAILVGDLALMCASRAVESASERLGAHGAAVRALFVEMMELVTAGQYLDMRIAAQPLSALPEQLDDIRATMRSKTASYTAEFPLALGAAAARGAGAAVRAARDAGLPAGLAFQLRDDLLGVVGDESQTGKSVGGDLREGKRTVPLWHAWTRADAPAQAILAAAVGHADATDAQVTAAVEVLRSTGAIVAVEDEIAELNGQAQRALALLDVPREAADGLAALLGTWGERAR